MSTPGATCHAVVLGAGIAGLAAAAVLAEHFSTVTVVERDRLPDRPTIRRGTSQGRHLHSLLSRGAQILDELLPGFLADLTVAGAVVLDDADMGRIYSRIGPYTFHRDRPVADPAALTTYLASRPFLEFHLRRRVMALGNVAFLDGHDVGELVAGDPERITGVTVHERDSGRSEAIDADLIIDATGRATRTPLLLDQLGCPRPEEQRFTADGVYHSQQIAIPDQDRFRERLILVIPEGRTQRGGLMACENDTWTLTIAGRTGDLGPVPTDFGAMRTLAAPFMPAHIQSVLQHAHPLVEVSTYRYPGGRWCRYDRMAMHPKGFLVIGDALCSLDPINGQGMTVAAIQALTLRTHLRRDTAVEPKGFYTCVAAVMTPIWATNVEQPTDRTVDEPRRSLRQRAVGWGHRKILEAAVDDIVVTERLMRVANLIDPPHHLLRPNIIAHVVAHDGRQILGGRHES